LARGERPRTERTSEERERARAERERRRAERTGEPLPPAPDPDDAVPPAPDPDDAVPPQPAEPEPGVQHPADEAAIAPDASAPPAAEPAPGVPVAPEPGEPPAPIEAQLEPPAPIEAQPEPPAPLAEEPPPAELEPWLAEETPIAPPEPAAPPDLPPEPVLAPDLVVAEEGHAPVDPPEAMDPPPVVPAMGEELPAEDAAPPHADEDEDVAPGYPIPGLPEDPGPQAREPLPEPPPRLRGTERPPMRRAFRREGAGAAGVGAGAAAAGLASDGRSSTRRRMPSRWAAVIALLVIGVVVALLIYGLTRSSSHTTAKAPPVVKVLIPEGKTRLQIAQIAQQAGLTGSYRRAARSSPLLNPVQYGAPHSTRTLEGFLFPATYDMDRGGPSARLVEDQLTAFQENFTDEDVKRARALGLTPYELLTVASMIEREAQVPSDRAKIAAVIYNRLKAGVPLGIDATTYYALENARNIPTYTKELTSSDLAMNSAYNTRIHKGLPPTPISNPGVASIQAAAHPAHVSYMYYVAGADGCGEQVFSTTEAKFQENVAAYEAAKRANGGHLPACKHH
jgi:cell division protein YceG involved in septum cleavage